MAIAFLETKNCKDILVGNETAASEDSEITALKDYDARSSKASAWILTALEKNPLKTVKMIADDFG